MLTRELADNAVLLIDKPPGITSNDALGIVKRATGVRKMGHSGTLDKFASGLLVVCTGMMTKLARFFLDHEKRYAALIRLGAVTDTLDTEGVILELRDIPHLTDDDMARVRQAFTGIIQQRPPEYSALKVGGVRASDLARAGREVVLSAREVVITELAISRVEGDIAQLRAEVSCSKGTYIRSLARDIGEFLGTGAHLEYLRRTVSGNFSVDDAVTLDELVSGNGFEHCSRKWILGPREALKDFGVITMKAGREGAVLNGGLFSRDDVDGIMMTEKSHFLVIDADKKLIAIVEPDFDKWNIRYLNVFNRQAD